ncbi:hypothetical protein MC28_0514 [Bacillus thuringiensis MC28]|nr:hypothetical protein MC28_0514 [Bacillus thuringiensis MC28]EEL60675.1 Aldehyde dehydrogenase (NAD(P)+) [Bacillus cereus Rock4-18]
MEGVFLFDIMYHEKMNQTYYIKNRSERLLNNHFVWIETKNSL